jgi:hypothetical protein
LIYTAGNEKYLGVHYFPEKGRGILSLKRFARNEFVVEYKGTFFAKVTGDDSA